MLLDSLVTVSYNLCSDYVSGAWTNYRNSMCPASGYVTTRKNCCKPICPAPGKIGGSDCVPEPGRSTLNVLNYKYKYFPPRKYLSTSSPFWGNVLKYIPSTFKNNVLKYNQEYISITEQFFVP